MKSQGLEIGPCAMKSEGLEIGSCVMCYLSLFASTAGLP